LQAKGFTEFVGIGGKPKVSLPAYNRRLQPPCLETGACMMSVIEAPPARQQTRLETLLLTFWGVSLASLSIYLFDTNSFFSLIQLSGFDVDRTDLIACLAAVTIGLTLTIYCQRRQAQAAEMEKYLYWSQTILRYFLGHIFLLYGFAKVFQQQFYSLPSTLDTPLGDISGLQLTWRFFGYSYAYTLFVAASQILGSILLFSRRTTLAALILLPVVANIVFVNFTHSIPVKLYSSIYLVMLLYLLAADFKRLKALFWDNLPFAGRQPSEFVKSRRLVIVKCLLIAVFFAIALGENYYGRVVYSKATTVLLGAWEVQEYRVNDLPQSPTEDATVWRKVYFDTDKLLAIKTGKPRPERFLSTLDAGKQTIKLENPITEELFVEGEYELLPENQLLIKVANGTDSLRVTLSKVR
jgi:uncharacterized membrane protein YphA (DoxX/SURF4 family)